MVHSKKPHRSIIKKFIGLAGILFFVALVLATVVYAVVARQTWDSGSAPQTAPGEGNVGLGLIIETRTSDPVSPETGRMWLRTDI